MRPEVGRGIGAEQPEWPLLQRWRHEAQQGSLRRRRQTEVLDGLADARACPPEVGTQTPCHRASRIPVAAQGIQQLKDGIGSMVKVLVSCFSELS